MRSGIRKFSILTFHIPELVVLRQRHIRIEEMFSRRSTSWMVWIPSKIGRRAFSHAIICNERKSGMFKAQKSIYDTQIRKSILPDEMI